MKSDKIVILCFFCAVVLRVFYLLTPYLDSDGAVVGLAARHILTGEFPLFFYGDSFEAVIEGYLAAPFFWLFDSSRLVLNCVPAIMSLLLILAVYKLAQLMFGNYIGKLTLIFSSIAPSYFLFMTTIPMEGYIESSILGAVAFIITYMIIYKGNNSIRLFMMLGFVLGFAFLLQFHIVPFALTIGLFLFLHDKKIMFKKHFFIMIAGFVLGNLPLLIYNITHNFDTLSVVGRGFNDSTLWGTIKHLFGYGFPVIIGARIDNTEYLYIPYISYIVVSIYAGSIIYMFFNKKRGAIMLLTCFLFFIVTYWFSGRGEVNTRRYLIPLYAIIPIILACFLNAIKDRNKYIFYSVFLVVLGSNLYTNIKSIPLFNEWMLINRIVEKDRDDKLYQFLESNNIKGAYAWSWWISLRFNFDFKEKIILNDIFDEPYPEYQRLVDSEENPAIISYATALEHTLDTIGGSYSSYSIPSANASFSPYNICYNFAPGKQTLEEIDNEGWSISFSHNNEKSFAAFDRDFATRWSSDSPQIKDMNFILDLGKLYSNVTRLLLHPGPKTDWPGEYELYVSTDKLDWKLVAKNSSFVMPVFWDGPHPFMRIINGFIEIDFLPQDVRYLKLVLTKGKEYYSWSIVEMFVYSRKNADSLDWDVKELKGRINQINPKKIYADPWVSSHFKNEGFYLIDKRKPVCKDYIYKYFVVKPTKIKDCVFVVLNENYPSVKKILGNTEIKCENYGSYKLIICKGNLDSIPYKLYWDGFHLLKLEKM
jgi:hypothetical protein